MLSNEISRKVLTIGCAYDPPRGGVAQVMYTYSKETFPVFRCVANSSNGGPITKLFLAIWGLLKMLCILSRDNNLRIVHIHTASYNSFKRSTWFVRLAKLMHRKVVLHIHGGAFKEYYKTSPEWILKQLKSTDYILALTDNWQKFFFEELHLPRVVKVPNIISYPQLFEIRNDGLLHLLFLGKICEQKGIFDLVELIKQHKSEWEGRLVLHIGGTQDVAKLVSLVKELGLEELIKYEGWVSGDKKTFLLNLMDVFILPSYVEGLPISILEALSYGKPVISTTVGGIPEIVNDNNGWLFSPGNKDAMSLIIQDILDNPDLLLPKRIAARESVREHFPEHIAETLSGIYEELLIHQ